MNTFLGSVQNCILTPDYEYDYSTSSRRSSEISAGSSLQQSMTSITSDVALPPQPPKYKPQMGSDTSTYYARVRTRASNDLSKKRDSLLNGGGENGSAPNSANVARKFDATARKHRSKTIEIGFTVKENKKEDDLADKEVENILSSESNLVTSEAAEASQEPPLSMSSLVITTRSPIKSPKKGLESRTSSDSLKVKAEETPKRMSPFNRFKNSLVLGTSNCSSPSSRNSKTPTESSKSPPIYPQSGSRRERTESETSTSRSSEKRSRFFYRKSRTGPVGNAEGENGEKSNSIHSSASNSTSNLTSPSTPVAIKEVEIVDSWKGAGASGGATSVAGASIRKFEDRHAVRAKSEFSPRSATASNSAGTSTSNEYVSKDNYFLAAAKRWASYDKPTYNTPFTRDHWRKSHRKFNYSRFLNYTRETFV